MATIKELSESIGISKVGLNKWIERNGYKDRLQKIGNKYIVPADVEQVVRSYFDRRDTKPQKVVQNTDDAEKEITSEILALLREQLEVKDREIERLHQQVDDLQRINADMTKAVRELNTIQAMLLTDGSGRVAVEDQDQSESKVSDPAGDQTSEEQARKPRRLSFFERIKGKF